MACSRSYGLHQSVTITSFPSGEPPRMRLWRCPLCSAELAAGVERPRLSCPACGAIGLWQPPVHRAASDIFASGAATPWSAKALAAETWEDEVEPITGLSYSSTSSFWIAVGPPGSAKTTTMARVAAAQSPEREVVLISGEMRVGPALTRMLRISGLGQRDNAIVQRQSSATTLVGHAARSAVIILDSLSCLQFTVSDCRAMADAGALVLAISQVRKDGRARGSNEFQHEAGIVVRFESDRAWTCTKSRWGDEGKTGHAMRRAIPKAVDNVVQLADVAEEAE